jgi:hypothetical protein
MSRINVHEQPIIKLSDLQFKVYEAVKHCQPSTADEVLVYLKDVKKTSLASALRALREKGLVVYENLVYKVTNKTFFELRSKRVESEPCIHASNIQDQLEWNRQILQQKALREARMRINV